VIAGDDLTGDLHPYQHRATLHDAAGGLGVGCLDVHSLPGDLQSGYQRRPPIHLSHRYGLGLEALGKGAQADVDHVQGSTEKRLDCLPCHVPSLPCSPTHLVPTERLLVHHLGRNASCTISALKKPPASPSAA